ncbi:MAG: hypothetical protein ABEJ56_07100 [Candidatus Nanohaloarchaea archaeon]
MEEETLKQIARELKEEYPLSTWSTSEILEDEQLSELVEERYRRRKQEEKTVTLKKAGDKSKTEKGDEREIDPNSDFYEDLQREKLSPEMISRKTNVDEIDFCFEDECSSNELKPYKLTLALRMFAIRARRKAENGTKDHNELSQLQNYTTTMLTRYHKIDPHDVKVKQVEKKHKREVVRKINDYPKWKELLGEYLKEFNERIKGTEMNEEEILDVVEEKTGHRLDFLLEDPFYAYGLRKSAIFSIQQLQNKEELSEKEEERKNYLQKTIDAVGLVIESYFQLSVDNKDYWTNDQEQWKLAKCILKDYSEFHEKLFPSDVLYPYAKEYPEMGDSPSKKEIKEALGLVFKVQLPDMVMESENYAAAIRKVLCIAAMKRRNILEEDNSDKNYEKAVKPELDVINTLIRATEFTAKKYFNTNLRKEEPFVNEFAEEKAKDAFKNHDKLYWVLDIPKE